MEILCRLFGAQPGKILTYGHKEGDGDIEREKSQIVRHFVPDI